MENKWKNKNFFQSLKNAINGIKFVWQYGSNIKIQFVFAIFAIILGGILKLSLVEFAILILTIFIVLICEVINTAIEKIVDLYTLEYNEIAKVVKDFKKELPSAKIYVYDNNSTDNSAKLAKDAGAIVRQEIRQGKGNVVRSMFRDIEADCYLMVDADDTYSVKEAKKMCNLVLKDNYDMVVGDRLSSTYFIENKRLFHNFGNRIVRFLINKLFRASINDIMSGYRAFSYEFVKSYPVLSKRFEIETEMTIHAIDKNFRVKTIPISYKDRINGSVSKLNNNLK